jgi:hypothetical protein
MSSMQQDRGEYRHAPDFFAMLADGTGIAIDVRPDDQVEPTDVRRSLPLAAPAMKSVGSSRERVALRVGDVPPPSGPGWSPGRSTA